LLVQSDGNNIRISSIEFEQKQVTVYNMTVADFHTYFVSDLGIWVHNTGKCPIGGHGNKVDDREATLYKKVDSDGDFRKWGITQYVDPTKRYTKAQIDGGDVIPIDRGPRREMLDKECDLVETNPGPDNREPWAGRRKNNLE
jgi:hypothetical protein